MKLPRHSIPRLLQILSMCSNTSRTIKMWGNWQLLQVQLFKWQSFCLSVKRSNFFFFFFILFFVKFQENVAPTSAHVDQIEFDHWNKSRATNQTTRMEWNGQVLCWLLRLRHGSIKGSKLLLILLKRPQSETQVRVRKRGMLSTWQNVLVQSLLRVSRYVQTHIRLRVSFNETKRKVGGLHFILIKLGPL